MAASPHLSVDELLTHGAWMRRLACALIGRADADDAVQDAYLAALESPPPRDRPLGRWLARVVRNEARMQARSDRQRGRRELAAHTDAAVTGANAPPGADVLLERVRLQQLLARLVGDLDEAVRTTLLLRYSEGLSAAEIARATQRPAGTVRWRLKQGLDALRAQLDRELGDAPPDRRDWRRGLAPLALMQRGDLDVAAAAGKGALLMKTSSVAISMVAAVAVIAGGVYWSRGDAAERGDAAAPVGAAAPPAAPTTPAVAATPAAAAPAAPAAPDPARAAQRARYDALAARLAVARARREQLAAATRLTAAATPATPAAPPTPGFDREQTRAYIMRGMDTIRPLIDECYLQALERAPGLEGKVAFKIRLAAEEDIGGIVESAELDPMFSSISEPGFLECVAESVYAAELGAPPKGGGQVSFSFPFVFSPPTGEDEEGEDEGEDE